MAKYSNRIRVYRSHSIAEFFVTHRKTGRLKSKQHIWKRISYVIHLDKVTTKIDQQKKTHILVVSRARSSPVILISNEIAIRLLLFSQVIRRASIRVTQFFFVQRNNNFFFGIRMRLLGWRLLKRIRTRIKWVSEIDILFAIAVVVVLQFISANFVDVIACHTTHQMHN